MLYDHKRWEKPKINPLSWESLIAWLEMQPDYETYCYSDNGNCLLGQYFTAMGFRDVTIYAMGNWEHRDDEHAKYPWAWDQIVVERPRTFGGALWRARQALALR